MFLLVTGNCLTPRDRYIEDLANMYATKYFDIAWDQLLLIHKYEHYIPPQLVPKKCYIFKRDPMISDLTRF